MSSNNTKDNTGPSSLSASLPSSSHTAFDDEIKLSNNNNSNSNSNSNQSNYDFVDTENQIATQKHKGGGGGEKEERGLLVNSSMLSNDNDDGNTTTSTSGVSTGTVVTYPADCYSFLALYHPWENFRYWSFGFIVWMFQVVFLILMIMRVVSKKWSTNEGTYERY